MRCASTGRKCDGYGKMAPPRTRTEDALRALEVARRQFFHTCHRNQALRSMRTIAADIAGTETERRFFHGFRNVAAIDGLAVHVCNFTTFWQRLLPQLSHRDDAVKHAFVALGSAYQLYQHQADDSTLPGFATRKDLEVFVLQQYNMSSNYDFSPRRQ